MADPLFAAGEHGDSVRLPRILVAALGAPVAWAAHLVVCYFLVTLDCITGWDGSGWAVALVTVALAGAALASGWLALRIRRQHVDGVDPEARGWIDFVTVLGIAGSPLFALVIVVTGLAPAFTATCA
jgi:MFS family permease